jgi:hypothetical protein
MKMKSKAANWLGNQEKKSSDMVCLPFEPPNVLRFSRTAS